MTETIKTFARDSAMSHFVLVAVTKLPKLGQLSLPLVIELKANGVELPFEETINDLYERFKKQAYESAQAELGLIEELRTKEGLESLAKELAKKMCLAMADKFEWDE